MELASKKQGTTGRWFKEKEKKTRRSLTEE